MPVTLMLIASHLSPIEQGFYYSFAGVQALAVLGELGIAFVVSQFAAHEHAHIVNSFDQDQAKSRLHSARLASILKLGVFWNLTTFLLCCLLLLPGGYWFFSQNADSAVVNWRMPWIAFAGFSALGLVLSPVFAVLNGIGYIGDSAKIQLIQTIASTVVAWGLLMGGYGLYAIVALPAMSVLGGSIGIFLLHRVTLMRLMKHANKTVQVNYFQEIFPLQSKVALSWLSGYVGFYFATPLIFSTLSPEIAGKYGMTANLLLSISGVAAIWVNAKGPLLAQLAAVNENIPMLQTFLSTTLKSVVVLVAGYIVLLLCMYIAPISERLSFLERIIRGPTLYLLMGGYAFSHVYGLLNVYLRAFKADPLFWLSISSAAIYALALPQTSRLFGLGGVAWVSLVVGAVTCSIGMAVVFKTAKIKCFSTL